MKEFLIVGAAVLLAVAGISYAYGLNSSAVCPKCGNAMLPCERSEFRPDDPPVFYFCGRCGITSENHVRH